VRTRPIDPATTNEGGKIDSSAPGGKKGGFKPDIEPDPDRARRLRLQPGNKKNPVAFVKGLGELQTWTGGGAAPVARTKISEGGKKKRMLMNESRSSGQTTFILQEKRSLGK